MLLHCYSYLRLFLHLITYKNHTITCIYLPLLFLTILKQVISCRLKLCSKPGFPCRCCFLVEVDPGRETTDVFYLNLPLRSWWRCLPEKTDEVGGTGDRLLCCLFVEFADCFLLFCICCRLVSPSPNIRLRGSNGPCWIAFVSWPKGLWKQNQDSANEIRGSLNSTMRHGSCRNTTELTL